MQHAKMMSMQDSVQHDADVPLSLTSNSMAAIAPGEELVRRPSRKVELLRPALETAHRGGLPAGGGARGTSLMPRKETKEEHAKATGNQDIETERMIPKQGDDDRDEGQQSPRRRRRRKSKIATKNNDQEEKGEEEEEEEEEEEKERRGNVVKNEKLTGTTMGSNEGGGDTKKVEQQEKEKEEDNHAEAEHSKQQPQKKQSVIAKRSAAAAGKSGLDAVLLKEKEKGVATIPSRNSNSGGLGNATSAADTGGGRYEAVLHGDDGNNENNGAGTPIVP